MSPWATHAMVQSKSKPNRVPKLIPVSSNWSELLIINHLLGRDPQMRIWSFYPRVQIRQHHLSIAPVGKHLSAWFFHWENLLTVFGCLCRRPEAKTSSPGRNSKTQRKNKILLTVFLEIFSNIYRWQNTFFFDWNKRFWLLKVFPIHFGDSCAFTWKYHTTIISIPKHQT